jgi:hypothetical protein
VALEFLSEAEVDYLRFRLASDVLPADLAALVHARTDGTSS